jgi:hypothetical protein
MATAPEHNSASSNTPAWDIEETSDLVTYLYDRRSCISRGRFKSGTFTSLQHFLNRKYPERGRTHGAVSSKNYEVRTLSY